MYSICRNDSRFRMPWGRPTFPWPAQHRLRITARHSAFAIAPGTGQPGSMTPVDSTAPATAPQGSFWAPFAQPAFLVIWSATLVGNLATSMRELAAAWLMTSLSISSVDVGMVKAAAALPVLLLALPAGALADTFNRRYLNISVNSLLALVTAGIGLATLSGGLTPALLVAAIFVTGIGSAVLQPTQQSLVPLLVDRTQLEQAVALNGMGLNLSRAVGPAIAGVLVAGIGTAAAFFANAFGYLIVIAAFVWWKGAATPAVTGVPERIPGAMLAGVRFVRHASRLRRVLARLAWFVFVASAYWTLLPVLVRRDLGGSPGLYGALLAAIGIGTVLTTLALPRLRERLSPENTFRLGLAATGAVLAALAWGGNVYLVALAAVLAGAAWLAALTVANVAAQSLLPDWMRGRGMAIYLAIFAGAMTAGSLAWGWVADHFSLHEAFATAALAGVAGIVYAWRYPLPETPPDLRPGLHWWPEPHVQQAIPADRGPALVSIEYQIEPHQALPFLALLRELSKERLRNGAYQWGVFEDVTLAGRYVETFLMASWEEYERLYRRVSADGAEREAMVMCFHRGPEAPLVRHWITPPTH